jgi:hypothetical protein
MLIYYINIYFIKLLIKRRTILAETRNGTPRIAVFETMTQFE